MTIPATVLSLSQAAVKAAFTPTSVNSFLEIVAMPGATKVTSGIYFVTARRGVRGCNGNSWLTLRDNELGSIELSWREVVFSQIESIKVLKCPSDVGRFFANAEAVTATVVVEVPTILDPVSTALEAPMLNWPGLLGD